LANAPEGFEASTYPVTNGAEWYGETLGDGFLVKSQNLLI
jgi:hypothetical protein